MSARLASLPLSAFNARHAWARGLLAVLLFVSAVISPTADGGESAASAAADEARAPVMPLAAKIANLGSPGHAETPADLLAAYETVYGNVNQVPSKWPALVRRVLVCRATGNQACVHSSMIAIGKLGGIDKLPLNHMMEVSRFNMSAAAIRTTLLGSVPVGDGAGASAAVPAHVNQPAAVVASDADAYTGITSASVPAKAAGKGVSDKKAASVKPPAPPRTLVQRASARLKRLGGSDQAGFFLDALFVSVSISLVLAYFLFSATRARKAKPFDPALASLELRQLEELRVQEKAQMENDVSLIRLNAEMAVEEQKAFSDSMFATAQREAEAAIQNEKARIAELLKDERQKMAETVEAANARAKQMIEAAEQASAAECAQAQRQMEELQQVLNSEKIQGANQQLRAVEALQEVDALKFAELRLQDLVLQREDELAQARRRIDELQQSRQPEPQEQAPHDVPASKLEAAQQAVQLMQAQNAQREAETRLQEITQLHTAELAQARERADSLQHALNVEQAQNQAHTAAAEEAQQQIEAVQRALNTEHAERDMQAMRTEEIQRTVEVLMAEHARLQESVLTERAEHEAEIQKMSGKLKSAQRAVVTLHTSLLAERTLNADASRVEPGKRAAEPRQPQSIRPEQERSQAAKREAGKQGVEAATFVASNDS